MGYLDKITLINENMLDQKHYFQSLFQEACRTGLLSELEIERFQLELVGLMGKEVERYTNDESSSVPVEKAQQILQSITFNIGCFLKSTTDMTQKIDILRTEKVSAMFIKGMEAVGSCKVKAENMLKELQKNNLKLDNYSYRDTITGLSGFFHDYNIEFTADEIPGDIDYQLYQTITDLLGVEYIYKYLDCFTREDKFLRYFTAENINLLLKGFDRDAEHMLINIFELVLNNALGRILLGHKAYGLGIGKDELPWLQKSLESLNKEELEHRLESALNELNQEMLMEPEVYTYARAALPHVASRLMANLQTDTLGRIFTAFYMEPENEFSYVDGIPMEDEKLRNLIEQLRYYKRTADRVRLMRQHITSMADFAELIEECFFEEEYDEVFTALSDQDRVILQKILQLEAGLEYDEYYEPDKLWKKRFLLFGNNMR